MSVTWSLVAATSSMACAAHRSVSEGMSNNQRGWSVFAGNPTIGTNIVAVQAMCLDYTP